jgi:tRNA nucleotidyltransferase (CCA-adding enzyme)
MIRAAGLAEPTALVVGGTTTVERALDRLARREDLSAVVVGADPPIGGLTRRDLERARAFGLNGLELRRLLVGEVQTVTPESTLQRVLQALSSSPAPFCVVRSVASQTRGIVDRLMLLDCQDPPRFWRARSGLGREGLSSATVGTLEKLGSRAQRAGTRACLVGGGVRDLLLGRPVRDLDVVVEGEVLPLIRGLGRARTHHSRFGTASVTLEDGTTLDLARSRTETYAGPAALPVVSPAPIEQDSSRRDFTINTLAFSLDPRRFGSILDLHGGVADLGRGHVRVLYGLSFVDDPTRGFRAVRLAARLGFEIESRTAATLRLAVRHGAFARLSPVRLRREVEAMLEAREFPAGLRLAARFGLLTALHPGLKLPVRVRSSMARAARAMDWYESLEGRAPFRHWLIPLGLLFGEMGRRASLRLLARLAPGRRDRQILERAVAGVAQLLAELDASPRPKPSRIYAICRGREVEILLMALATARRERTRRMLRLHLEFQRRTKLLIGGRDLLRHGVAPGPAVACGLEAALNARLDGCADSREEQLHLALRAATPSPDSA